MYFYTFLKFIFLAFFANVQLTHLVETSSLQTKKSKNFTFKKSYKNPTRLNYAYIYFILYY